jgi:hypothetical protein
VDFWYFGASIAVSISERLEVLKKIIKTSYSKLSMEKLPIPEIQMSFSIWHDQMEKYEKRREHFLEWAQKTYNIRRVYYPGSGADRLPKETLGEKIVVHLSKEENKSVGGYFPRLGSGLKVEGNFLQTPFKDGSFDVVYIHDTPIKTTAEGLEEFARVLKNDGALLLDNGNWDDQELLIFLGATREMFQDEKLPSEFNNPANLLASISRRKPGASGGISVGLATSARELQQMIKNIPEEERHIIRQVFASFKKKG